VTVYGLPRGWTAEVDPGRIMAVRLLLLGSAGQVLPFRHFALRLAAATGGFPSVGVRIGEACFGDHAVACLLHAPGATAVSLVDRRSLRGVLADPGVLPGPVPLRAAYERGQRWLLALPSPWPDGPNWVEQIRDLGRLREVAQVGSALGQDLRAAQSLAGWAEEAARQDPRLRAARRRLTRALTAAEGTENDAVVAARTEALQAAARARHRHASKIVDLLLNDRLRAM
jgi:hypothetical protein